MHGETSPRRDQQHHHPQDGLISVQPGMRETSEEVEETGVGAAKTTTNTSFAEFSPGREGSP